MLTSSGFLALAGICVAVLLVGAVVVLLARTGRSPSSQDRRAQGRHRDDAGSPGTPSPRAAER